MSTFKTQLTQSVLALALTLNLPLIAQAEDVQLVAEMNPTGNGNVYSVTAFNDKLCFSAYDVHGRELWCYDGENAPSMVADIFPGRWDSSPSDMAVFQNKLYFAATHPDYGRELWTYDGVNAPYLVADLNPAGYKNDTDSRVGDMHVFNDKLYFSGVGANHKAGFWVYDGVNPPTLVQGEGPDQIYWATELTTVDDHLYFVAYHGGERTLWEYDGENPATIIPIEPANTYSGPDPRFLEAYQGKLYFVASHAVHGRQIWSYDGQNPPAPVGNIVIPEGASYNQVYPFELTTFANKLYFTAAYITPEDEYGRLLTVYDAATPSVPPTIFEDSLKYIQNLAVWNDKLYFSGYEPGTGFELWSYDGENPPSRVEDINTGHYSSQPRGMAAFNGKLYFGANNSKIRHGFDYELFVLDPEATPDCQIYGVHDEGLNDSQLFTIANAYGNDTTVQDEYGNVVTVIDEYYNVVTLGELQFDFDIEGLDLHPNGKDLYASSGDDTDAPGELYKVDTDNGNLVSIGATGFAEVDAISFNPADTSLWGWAQGQGLIEISVATGQGTLAIAYDGEIEGLTWDNSGLMLYAVENLHQGNPDAQLDNQGVRLWRYDASNDFVSEACQPDAFSAEVEALEALDDGSLLFTYHGANAIHSGIITFTSDSECEVFELEPIATPFDDVEGLAYPLGCVQ